MPGVHAVFTYADLPESMRRRTVPLLVPSPTIKQALMPYCLAKDEVCFVGEPVAIVVADSRYLAEDAAAQVDVDYEVLPAVSDPAKGLAPGAPLAHRGSPNNLAGFIPIKVGDTDAAFAQAAHVFREKIFQHRGGPFFMECRGMIAVPDPVTDALTIYVSSQGPHRHKRVLLDLMDWADHQLRIVTPDVGGGFGPKGSFYAEYGALAAAALSLRRPVKWIEDRRENFLSTQQERDQYWDVEIAVDARRARSSACAARSCTTPAPTCPGAWCCRGSPRPRCRGPMSSRRSSSTCRSSSPTRCRPRRCAAPAVRKPPSPWSG